MRATVLCISLTLLYVTHAGATDVQKDFDLNRFLGAWHGVAFATNSDWFLGKIKCAPCLAQLNLTADGNIELTRSNTWPQNSPTSVTTYTVTSVPGVFHARKLNDGYQTEFRVVETDYDAYAMTMAYMTVADWKFTLVKLMSRTQDITSDLVDKFEDYALQKGLTKDNIVFSPRKEGVCNPDANAMNVTKESSEEQKS
ncbi:lipocalin-like [Protopterus annectens]|uniref:lipocalin-like n=1 Tax=Protopterus annectens TaxID=7888 RepID=UPI001CFA8C28|nr:lipocalin-like [Protopterus annectens]